MANSEPNTTGPSMNRKKPTAPWALPLPRLRLRVVLRLANAGQEITRRSLLHCQHSSKVSGLLSPQVSQSTLLSDHGWSSSPRTRSFAFSSSGSRRIQTSGRCHRQFAESTQGVLVEKLGRDAGFKQHIDNQLSIDQGFRCVDAFHQIRSNDH